jgi:hypothetical protein
VSPLGLFLRALTWCVRSVLRVFLSSAPPWLSGSLIEKRDVSLAASMEALWWY